MSERVLIVETDWLHGRQFLDALSEAGLTPIGPFATVDAALNVVKTKKFEAALIDMTLGGFSSLSLATALQQKGIPFAFISASARSTLPDDFRNIPFVGKPFIRSKIVSLTRELCAGRACSHTKSGLL